MRRKYILFFIFIFAMFFITLVTSNLYAQSDPGEEEEEEPVQARPNPMDKTMRGPEEVMRGSKKIMMKETAMQQEVSDDINSNGINSNGIASNGMVEEEARGKLGNAQMELKGEAQGMVEEVSGMQAGSASVGKEVSGNKDKLEGLEDDKPNPMANVSDDGEHGDSAVTSVQADVTSALGVFGGNEAGGTGDPMAPFQGSNAGYDGVDGESLDPAQEFGGKLNAGF